MRAFFIAKCILLNGLPEIFFIFYINFVCGCFFNNAVAVLVIEGRRRSKLCFLNRNVFNS
jgi:hypothetical protein